MSHIRATYYLDFGDRVGKFAESAREFFDWATMGSSHKYDYINYSKESFLRGRLLEIQALPETERRGYVKIEFDDDTFHDKDLSLLLSYLLYSSVQGNTKALTLIDLELPMWFSQAFKGPRYGTQGIRDMLSINGRPLFGVILKPRQGLTPHLAATIAEAAIKGGADYIVDDELMVNQRNCPFIERVESICNSIARTAQSQRRKVMYVINITGDLRNSRQWLKLIHQLGNEHVQIAALVNAFLMGSSSVQELVEEANGIPLISSQVSSAMMIQGSAYAISESILVELSRIAGADGVYAIRHATEYQYEPSKLDTILFRLESSLGSIKSSMPVYSGAISLGSLLHEELPRTTNFMLQAGSTICGFQSKKFRFPSNIELATRIFTDTIEDIYLHDKSCAEVARDLAKKYHKSNSLDILISLGYQQ